MNQSWPEQQNQFLNQFKMFAQDRGRAFDLACVSYESSAAWVLRLSHAQSYASVQITKKPPSKNDQKCVSYLLIIH